MAAIDDDDVLIAPVDWRPPVCAGCGGWGERTRAGAHRAAPCPWGEGRVTD